MPRTIWLVMIDQYPGEAFLYEENARKFVENWRGKLPATLTRIILADWSDRFLLINDNDA